MSAIASTGRPFILRKGIASAADLRDGAALTAGVGNVYYVIKTNETHYANFCADHQGTYPDGTDIVYGATAASSHTAIQAAVTACVEGRNDYIVIMPSDSDYDLTAVVTLNKKSIHVICPAGLGLERGATNACRLHQNTASTAIFAVADASIEIAGLYLKQYADASHITVAATSYGLNIHHNMFPLTWSSSPSAVIACSGDGGGWGQVAHHNYFVSQGGDDVTCASMITIGASATGARCDYNDFFLGDGNIATVGISQAATKGTANYNNFMTAGSDGSFTHCIALGSYATAIGNRGTVADSVLITGGTASYSLSDNMNGASGGLIDEA